MQEPLVILAALPCAVWLWLLLFRDGFWRADQRLEKHSEPRRDWPGVAIVVPARDEAVLIETTIKALLKQDYPGALSIILVDDHSADDTVAKARALAGEDRLTIVSAPPLPRAGPASFGHCAMGSRPPETSPSSAIIFSSPTPTSCTPRTAFAGSWRRRNVMVATLSR